MSHNLLKGKRGIIFGALNDMSIAWKVAERAVEEGATITLSNTPIAVRMGQVDALAEKLNAQVIPADATSVEDLETVFAKSVEILGGKIDFVLHSIGMSPNVRKKRTYDDLDYGMLEKSLDISAISFHKMLQVAKKQDAIAENGSVVALSYVAAQRTFFGYMLIYTDAMRAVAENLHIATDDGSEGFKGLVTQVIDELIGKQGRHYDECVAIGPMIMMKFVALTTKKYALKTTVSLNALMVDGTGMCGACRVTVIITYSIHPIKYVRIIIG